MLEENLSSSLLFQPHISTSEVNTTFIVIIISLLFVLFKCIDIRQLPEVSEILKIFSYSSNIYGLIFHQGECSAIRTSDISF